MNINELMNVCGEAAKANGWHEDRPVRNKVAIGISGEELLHQKEPSEVYESRLRNWQGMKIMLMVSELSEAVEELRKGLAADATYYPTAKNDYMHPEAFGHKPEGVPSELADTIIRILDFCYTEGIDIGAIIDEKLAFNATRGYRHGKVA